MNFSVSLKSQLIGVFVNTIICGILVRVIVNVLRHVKLTYTQILKIVHGKNVFGKFILPCEGEILKTTETSVNDKEVTCEKVIVLFKFVIIW